MSASRQLCTFWLDRHYFGVDVEQVQEVLKHQPMTRVPLAPPAIRGLINLRGQIVTAIDLRCRLGLPARAGGQPPMNVILRAGADATGGISLLVDQIGEVLEVGEGALEPVPSTLTGPAREALSGVYKLEGRLLLALDVPRVTAA